MNLWTFGRTP